jgi:hypothetical protein
LIYTLVGAAASYLAPTYTVAAEGAGKARLDPVRSCDHRVVRWLITLSARRADVERLLSERVQGLSANPDDPSQLLLTLHDPEGDASPARRSNPLM